MLAHILALLNVRHSYGLDLFLLSIDEGITGRVGPLHLHVPGLPRCMSNHACNHTASEGMKVHHHSPHMITGTYNPAGGHLG